MNAKSLMSFKGWQNIVLLLETIISANRPQSFHHINYTLGNKALEIVRYEYQLVCDSC